MCFIIKFNYNKSILKVKICVDIFFLNYWAAETTKEKEIISVLLHLADEQ